MWVFIFLNTCFSNFAFKRTHFAQVHNKFAQTCVCMFATFRSSARRLHLSWFGLSTEETNRTQTGNKQQTDIATDWLTESSKGPIQWIYAGSNVHQTIMNPKCLTTTFSQKIWTYFKFQAKICNVEQAAFNWQHKVFKI